MREYVWITFLGWSLAQNKSQYMLAVVVSTGTMRANESNLS